MTKISISLDDCNCNKAGSQKISCDKDGKCKCKTNINGDKCDECGDGLTGFPDCQSKVFYYYSIPITYVGPY